MISRRLGAVALSLLAFAGCHDDPRVASVAVVPSAQALGLIATGGAASSAPGTDGTGGRGGDFMITTNGLISLGIPTSVPSAPAIPAQPSTFASTPVTPVPSGPTPVGSILISGNVTTTATASALIESLNGDIVIAGTLQSGNAAGAQTNITLRALNGTVFVSGSVLTAGVDSLSNGLSGGNLTILAARVVITGTIDTHGVANTTAATFNGGNGGAVDISSTQAPIYFTGGSINTTGGACVDTGGNSAIQGGAGGSVTLNSGTPHNSVFVFAPITTDGGAMTGNGTSPQGGKGGDITIQGIGEVDLVAGLSSLGGAAKGNAADAIGGGGGSLRISGAATARIFGSLTQAGGLAFAVNAGGGVKGGNGGSLLLGQGGARLDSVEVGSGNYSMAGGSGEQNAGTGGGQGGTVAIESFAGDITIGASLSVAGGTATGSGNAAGGAAGLMTIQTDAQTSGNLSNHLLSIDSLDSLLDASGGAATGTATGGAGGSVLLQCGGDLTSGARIHVSGGSSATGTGGPTTPLAPAVNVNSAVVLRVATGQLTPTGDLNVAGEILVQGGATTTGGIKGGAGASITLSVTGGNGSVSCMGTLNSTGGSDTLGTGGASGNVFLSCASGNLDLSGSLTVTGAASPSVPANGGNVTITCGGVLTSSASINAAGGKSTDTLGFVAGGVGGTVIFDATSAFGGLTLLSGTSVVADGGGTTSGTGGAGGGIHLQSRGQAIDMTGLLTARGGAAGGAGAGGLGGQLIASSDFANSGTAGNITLSAGSGIDVSGGSGSVQGRALVNPAPPPTPPSDPGPTFSLPIPLAVIFDADGSFATSGTANPGRITNSGTITATGSVGGDVWYGGLNSLGVPLGSSDGVGLNVTGLTPGHFYFH